MRPGIARPSARSGFDAHRRLGSVPAGCCRRTRCRTGKPWSRWARTIPNCASRSGGSAPAIPAPTGGAGGGGLSDRVRQGTDEGRLPRRLIPEEYGGSGLPLRAAAVILEEINASRLRRQPGPRADVHHGHAAAARQRGAEAPIPAGDRRRRAAPAGVRRDRADHRLRHHAAEDPRGARRRSLRRQRPEGLDLARACTPT